MGIGSDSVIGGSVRMMIVGFNDDCLIGFGMSDDFGQFNSRNILYDPGKACACIKKLDLFRRQLTGVQRLALPELRESIFR